VYVSAFAQASVMSAQEDALCPYIGNLCPHYINMVNITISLTPKLEAPIAVAMAVQPYAISSAIRHSSKHESSRPPTTSKKHLLLFLK
jgi:hypothetical protein